MLCSNACTISLQYINNIVTTIAANKSQVAQVVEQMTGETVTQVQSTLMVT